MYLSTPGNVRTPTFISCALIAVANVTQANSDVTASTIESFEFHVSLSRKILFLYKKDHKSLL
jgi:hypothetical protein